MSNLHYKPESVSPPGETLNDLIDERGLSQKVLGLRLGRSDKNLSQVINGKAPISPELALDLERVLGTPARFWLEREARYQEWVSRQNAPNPTEDDLEWARSFTYSKMAENNWVQPTTKVQEKFQNLLTFFGVVDRNAYQAWQGNLRPHYRRSTVSSNKEHLIAAWLRQGEIKALEIETNDYNEKDFGRAVESARAYTCDKPEIFIPKLEKSFAESGVVLLFVPELPGMGVSGATRWLTSSKALIQITLRYKYNDHLWFTIFHETCHILRHPKKAVFLETSGVKSSEEVEADTFSANLMIPPNAFREFVQKGRFDSKSVQEFALNIGIAPGIVVGRLQRENLLTWDSLNHLRVKYQWSK